MCIRLIFGLHKFDHVSDFRRQLNWLPVRLRRNLHILTLLFNILKLSSPPYLRERFQLAIPSERPVLSCVTLRKLKFPIFNTFFYEKSFTVQAARL